MYQVRMYALSTPDAASEYFNVHWKKHVDSLKKFNIQTVAVFKEEKEKGKTHVIAICKYEDGADIDAVNKAYMKSKIFREDMKGFNILKMRGVKDYTVEIDDYITERNI